LELNDALAGAVDGSEIEGNQDLDTLAACRTMVGLQRPGTDNTRRTDFLIRP
jgi:hypothetical protein